MPVLTCMTTSLDMFQNEQNWPCIAGFHLLRIHQIFNKWYRSKIQIILFLNNFLAYFNLNKIRSQKIIFLITLRIFGGVRNAFERYSHISCSIKILKAESTEITVIRAFKTFWISVYEIQHNFFFLNSTGLSF